MKAHLPNNPIHKYKYIYHFLPHKEHKTRARFLSHGALISYSFVMLAAVFMFRLVPQFAPGVLGYASNISTGDLLKYTNEQRARVGLKPLKLNNTLSIAAQKKAEDMFKVGYWAHVSPVGVKPWDFILGEGYDYLYAGENLAKNFSTSKEVVQAWYDSPTHRENLLGGNYDDIGFAVVNGVLDGYETTLVVQMFGRPRVPTSLASAEPSTPAPASVDIPAEQPAPAIAQVSGESDLDVSPVNIEEEDPVYIVKSENLAAHEPVLDVRSVSRMMVMAFGGFTALLLGMDMWYSKRHGILKMSGHTFAHLAFLLVSIVSVMISVIPGSIL